MNFKLDTSGSVALLHTGNARPQLLRWTNLTPFTQGYIEALFASVVNGSTPLGGDHALIPDVWAFHHLAPEALVRIIEDCAARVSLVHPELRANVSGDASEGAAFWKARQSRIGGHGGRGFPPLTVTLGDDGKVVFQ
jgi:hypothetical protein